MDILNTQPDTQLAKQPKLIHRVQDKIRLKYYSIRAEQDNSNGFTVEKIEPATFVPS